MAVAAEEGEVEEARMKTTSLPSRKCKKLAKMTPSLQKDANYSIKKTTRLSIAAWVSASLRLQLHFCVHWSLLYFFFHLSLDYFVSGNLFIKPIASSSEDGDDAPKKFSLLVRADTNLGNILLNISLTSLKFNAMGAKDVSFLCVPNPLPDPKMAADAPVIMLLRVKDSTIRDEVLEQLNSHA